MFISHVDTLYLYYGREYNQFLHAQILFADYPKLGYAKGYDWYDFGIARVGLTVDYDKTIRANTYPIIIEYNATYLLQTDFDDLKLFFSPDISDYHIKRIDFSYTINIEHYKSFDLLDSICVSKHFRKSSVIRGGNRKVETLYLGLRRTGKVFRMYNKTKELTDKKNHIKAQILHSHFGTTDNLLVFEIELHRKFLKDKCSITTLSDYAKLNDLATSLFTSLKFCEDSEANRKNMLNKNYDRIDFISPFENFLGRHQSFTFNVVKNYVKSKDFLINTIDDIIEQFNNRAGSKITYEELVTSLTQKSLTQDKIVEVSFEYETNPIKEEYNQTLSKISLLRDSQTNELELESRKYFG